MNGKHIKNNNKSLALTKQWKKIVSVFCVITVVSTFAALTLPAMTKKANTYCGFEEHTHSAENSCYVEKKILDCTQEELLHHHSEACYEEEEVLKCGMEKGAGSHAHSESCYQENKILICSLEENEEHTHSVENGCFEVSEELVCGLEESEGHNHSADCYKTEKVLICGLEEGSPEPGGHVHDESCYHTERELVCDKPEHVHTLVCFSNPDADLESSAVWERTFQNVELTGVWADDVLAIAESQLGYSESVSNYEVQEDGSTVKGYTRYGAWYGYPYGDWCAMFCSFCLNYAGVEKNLMPFEANCAMWIEKLSLPEFDLYHNVDEYTPQPGDLVFFDNNNDGRSDHVGLVAECTCDEVTSLLVKIKTIEGNNGSTVSYYTYDKEDSRIIGYGELPQKPVYLRTIESAPASNGAVAVISGNLPENAIAVIEAVPINEVDLSDYVGPERAGEIGSVVGYEISIIVDGEEWEPVQSVKVEILNTGYDASNGEYVTILHADSDAGEVSELFGVVGEDGSICFDTDGFSRFIPIPGEPNNGVAPLGAPMLGSTPTGAFDNSWSALSSPIYTVTGDTLTAAPLTNDTANLRGKIDLSLNAANYAVGDIEIRIPLHTIPSRASGEWADTISLGIPKYTEGMTISPEMPFTYVIDDNTSEIVITNSIPITDQISLNVIYSYYFTPNDVVDGTTGDVSAKYRLRTGGIWSSYEERSIDYIIDTVMDTPRVNKHYLTRYKNWQPEWGTAPANAADSCYIEYNVCINYGEVGGSQASSFSLAETPDSNGNIVFWGYKFSNYVESGGTYYSSWDTCGYDSAGIAALNLPCDIEDEGNLHGKTHILTVVVAYPESMGVDGSNFSNRIDVTQTPVDGIDEPAIYSAAANYTWKTTTFRYSNGISLYKYGQGSSTKLAYDTERPNSSSYNKTAVRDTGAATLLMNNIPASLVYRIDTSICSKDHTFKLNSETNEPILFQWSSETIDDQLYLNDELLQPGDYTFTSVEVSGSESRFDPTSASGSIGYGLNAGSDRIKEITDCWYRTTANGEWILLSDEYSSGRSTLPDDAYQIKVTFTGDAYNMSLYVYACIQLNPTDHVKSLLNEDGTDRIMNVAAMRFIDLNGIFCNPQDAASTLSGACASQIAAHDQAGGYGLEAGQALYHKAQTDLLDKLYFTGSLQKRAVSQSNDTVNRRVIVNYEVNPTNNSLGYGVGITDYNLAYRLYKEAAFRQEYAAQFREKLNHVLEDLTFYDLLPAGMTVDRGTVTVSTPSDSTNLIDSLDVIENWRGSNRTMIIAHVDASNSCEAYTSGIYASGAPGKDAMLVISVPVHLKYTAYYPWESLIDYGTSLHNVVALMNNTGDEINIDSGYMDDPSALSSSIMSAAEKAAFADLNGKTDTCKNTLYAHVSTNLNYETASISGFQKTVMGEHDAEYSELGATTTGGTYSYRLRYAPEDDQTSKDIIFYDVLEEAYDSNTHWKGTFVGVNVSQLQSKGVSPVVYYSTKTGIILSTPGTGDADLSKTSVWSTTPPTDLSTVTAIAVDARKTPGNQEFILGSKNSLVVTVQMNAPENSAGYVFPKVYAYNQAVIHASQKSESDVVWPMTSMNTSSVARVFIEDLYELQIKKIAGEDGRALPGATFRILDSKNQKVAEGVSDADGMLTLHGLKIDSSYTLEEIEAPESYMTSGPWTVDVDVDGTITVLDTHNNALNTVGGVYNIQNSKAGVRVILKKTNEETQRSGNNVTAIGSPVEGAVFALYETNLSVDDYLSEWTIDRNEALNHMKVSPMSGCEHMVSSADGVFSSEGFTLPYGIYCLVEQETPMGYLKTSDPIVLVVCNINGENSYADLDNIEVDQFSDGIDPDAEIWYSKGFNSSLCCIDSTNQAFTVLVVNREGFELPETGGMGTNLYNTLGGLVLLTGTLMYGYILRRKRERRNE